jgi:hypothetical protein
MAGVTKEQISQSLLDLGVGGRFVSVLRVSGKSGVGVDCNYRFCNTRVAGITAFQSGC